MSYSALCFLKTYPKNKNDLKQMLVGTPISDWAVTVKYGIYKLSNGEVDFLLAVNDPKKILNFSQGKVIEALTNADRTAEISLVQNASSVLQIWSDFKDPNMDYFNDFLFILEAAENKLQGVIWNWSAQELV